MMTFRDMFHDPPCTSVPTVPLHQTYSLNAPPLLKFLIRMKPSFLVQLNSCKVRRSFVTERTCTRGVSDHRLHSASSSDEGESMFVWGATIVKALGAIDCFEGGDLSGGSLLRLRFRFLFRNMVGGGGG